MDRQNPRRPAGAGQAGPDAQAAGREGSEQAAADRAQQVTTVRPETSVMTRQRLPYFVGISGPTAGAHALSMNLVAIPPGASAEPHWHDGYETAIYLLQGQVETRYGEGLRQSVTNVAGEFLFIPPYVPHQPRNLSQTETAYAIVARNDPGEKETVVPYDPAASGG